ncbi:tumor necrosis factor receptor superfamily member 6-like isoform X2 [Neolamprologus brichardi]|uniref:tumor necrosis factor receptor superfamily member 6-like isoform X2 n=1 Tax=Neolamprologus brichardi TaxID=32507 RepID=UPI001643BC51|nr:tumor necrosis factor receptor superfamily member 6-like isoform X2 [Neolamprologus brichardi]
MATKFSLWFSSCVWLAVSLSVNGASRIRREPACLDGTYNFTTWSCCNCPVGQRVIQHCSNGNKKDGKCEICENGKYNSEPSNRETCHPCTSCAQANANLEVEEECTIGRDTKCRCKTDHFCSSESCTICHPCKKCGFGGVKEACTANSDAVCNENGGVIAGIIIAVIIILVLIPGAVVGIIWIARRKQKKEDEKSKEKLIRRLSDVDIDPHLSDIARELGWKNARNLALRTGISMTTAESYEMEYRNDAEERTLQLLLTWVEKEGRQASKKLIENLVDMKQKKKAEQIRDILLKHSSPSNNPASNC